MSMFNSERDFEQNLYDFMVKNKLNPMNGREVISVIRQPGFGDYGIPDLIAFERDACGREFINVIELKNTCFHPKHINQVTGYMSLVKGMANFKVVFGAPNDLAGFLNVNMDMFPGTEIVGSILVVGQNELDSHELGINGLLFLARVTVYSLVIENMTLKFIRLTDGTPCIGASEYLQPALAKLKHGGE